jgi:YHS domain-containing protein
MEHDSLDHPAVRALARRSFVPVKLRSDLNQELALLFELSGLPATVIVAPSREVVALREGYLGPSELRELLEDSLGRLKGRAELSTAREPASDDASPGALAKRDARQANKKEQEVALSGFCPVSLVSDKRLVQGQAEYTVAHEGRLYRFANLISFNLFRRDPERYAPVNGGNCPVAQIDRRSTEPGDPRFGALFEGRLFLCATEADRQRFLREPARYAAVDVAEEGYCPHCLSLRGLLVRGDPRVELSREGRRYWFPDPSHREAFLAAAESSAPRR